MYQTLLIIFLIIAISLIGLIMLQQGKGTDIGGSTLSSSVSRHLLGATGETNFIIRFTAILAAIFFIISLILGNLNSNKHYKNNAKLIHTKKITKDITK